MDERTVLIVDDHDVLRGLLQSHLRQWSPNMRVLEASDGETAIARAMSEKPDAVIMDISLPGMNGIEAVRALKRMHPEMPIVILSIHELEAYRNDATAAGADAYVPKQHMQSELCHTLAELLGGGLACPKESGR